MKFDGRLKELYRKKAYSELFKALITTDEGTELFTRLCKEDDELAEWYVQFQTKFFDLIMSDPALDSVAEKGLEDAGLLKTYRFFKNVHTTGFTTLEEMAEGLGCTVADVKKDIEKINARRPGFIKPKPMGRG